MRAPNSLDALVPTYLSTLPGTGVLHYPRFAIAFCAIGEEDKCFGDRWLLSADATVEHFTSGCDRYVFAPSQNYPDDANAIIFYRRAAGDWAYESCD